MDYGDTEVLNAIMLLIRHTFVYHRIYGRLPNHAYMMLVFEIPYGCADHVITVAEMIVQRNTR